jgi:hypothetical protein
MHATIATQMYTSVSAISYRIASNRSLPKTQAPRNAEQYSHTLIGTIAEGWMLIKPITLTVERDETGAYLASDAVTTVYGYGESGPQAIQDYIQSLIEYFEIVDNATSIESVQLAGQLRHFLTKR